MRFNFDIAESSNEKNQQKSKTLALSSSPSSSTPTDKQLQWLPLQDHPVFSSFAAFGGGVSSPENRFAMNLMAWDGSSRIYYWDSEKDCLHRLSVRLGEPEPTSVAAASPSKVLQTDIELDYHVTKISINRNGSALLLAGSDCICVMYLYGCTSAKDGSSICRTVPVGSEVYDKCNSAIRILQVVWHPYSDTHIAVLSSDSVFRIFDLSSALDQPEQEYYLQPLEPGRSRHASSICPVDFSFGRDHLWDRFSVFVLFSDGSVYILCPVAPFGSVFMWESIVEIYSDAQTFGQKSTNSSAISNSSLAISWLEATFPELDQGKGAASNITAVKACPYVVIDASLSLQGPLRKVCHGEEDDPGFRGAECGGRAVSFLYNSVGKDSILVTAWSGGQLQIDALADEIQPLWQTGNPPHLSFDSHDRIRGFAMICESIADQFSVVRLDQPLDYCDWSGHPPPLLRLAIVDLALPKIKDSDSLISMFIDPLISERIYCLHDGGVDSIVLHFLPFTHQTCGKDEMMKTPSVHPVVNTYEGSTGTSSSLCGFVVLSDSFGYSWIAGVTSTRECIVLEMKTWDILLPKFTDTEKRPAKSEEARERITPDIISRELLAGPQMVIVPQGSNLRTVAADSIEGRSALHQYFKLFHENYVEYAHKVYFELKHHGPHLNKIIHNLHARLSEAKQRLVNVESKQPELDERISRAIERHEFLETRLQNLRKFPGIHKKPLTRAEREFKSELDSFTTVELDALQSSVEALNGRLRRYTQTLKGKMKPNFQRIPSKKKGLVQESQLDQLKSSLEKLSLVNSENSKKVKLVESALKDWEDETSK
ncbi:nuclear pore complex protein NUP88-like [Chenopodium quinoa]|uniref:nuclear pore complex protein NUP88-like n=1 Tax=Chenopodium quinoa TaxID=63459 RepID=UPI000B78EF98|nr:nuclear pore complex protein NUP88-like [Chenopodium quinoa]